MAASCRGSATAPSASPSCHLPPADATQLLGNRRRVEVDHGMPLSQLLSCYTLEELCLRRLVRGAQPHVFERRERDIPLVAVALGEHQHRPAVARFARLIDRRVHARPLLRLALDPVRRAFDVAVVGAVMRLRRALRPPPRHRAQHVHDLALAALALASLHRTHWSPPSRSRISNSSSSAISAVGAGGPVYRVCPVPSTPCHSRAPRHSVSRPGHSIADAFASNAARLDRSRSARLALHVAHVPYSVSTSTCGGTTGDVNPQATALTAPPARARSRRDRTRALSASRCALARLAPSGSRRA